MNPNKPSKKKTIQRLLKEGRSDGEIASETGSTQNYINKVRTQQKKEPMIKGDTKKKSSKIKTMQQPPTKAASPPPSDEEGYKPSEGDKKDLFTMSLDDAEALYASPAEVMQLLLHTKELPEERIKTQGKRLFNFLQKHQINIPYVEILLLMTGAAADYGMIIKDYIAEQHKKKMLATPKPPPPKVKEVTPEAHVKKSDPVTSKLIDKTPIKPSPPDMHTNKPKEKNINLTGNMKEKEPPKI